MLVLDALTTFFIDNSETQFYMLKVISDSNVYVAHISMHFPIPKVENRYHFTAATNKVISNQPLACGGVILLFGQINTIEISLVSCTGHYWLSLKLTLVANP